MLSTLTEMLNTLGKTTTIPNFGSPQVACLLNLARVRVFCSLETTCGPLCRPLVILNSRHAIQHLTQFWRMSFQ